MSERWILSVSQLNEYVRRTLAGDPMLSRVTLRGEISNFKRHSSGHLYFSLKDASARINCVMFRQYALECPVVFADGMQVILTGSVGLYTRDGQYQLYVQAARMDGVGELYQRFEALKMKLSSEGLFDAAIKRPMPLLPTRIGVVTSPTGAVIRDILQVARRRNPRMDILLYPASVQGTAAAGEIVKGLRCLSGTEGIDVIILARGGGSIEDLWPFNEEKVARAIRASRVPVVSAVGHETDFTIADFAADLRAPTPSAAAEMTVPRMDELQQQLDALRVALVREQTRMLLRYKERLTEMNARMAAHRPAQILRENRLKLQALCVKMQNAMDFSQQARWHALTTLKEKAEMLSPQTVLRRGYTLLRRDGRLVTRAAELSTHEQAEMLFYDGSAQVQILSINQTGSATDGDAKKSG